MVNEDALSSSATVRNFPLIKYICCKAVLHLIAFASFFFCIITVLIILAFVRYLGLLGRPIFIFPCLSLFVFRLTNIHPACGHYTTEEVTWRDTEWQHMSSSRQSNNVASRSRSKSTLHTSHLPRQLLGEYSDIMRWQGTEMLQHRAYNTSQIESLYSIPFND